MNEHWEVRAKRILRAAGYNHIKACMKNDVIHFSARMFTRMVLGVLIGNNIRIKLGANVIHEIYFEPNVKDEDIIIQAIQHAKRYYCLVKVSDYIPDKEHWHGLKYIPPKQRRQPRIVNVLPTSKFEDILKNLEKKNA